MHFRHLSDGFTGRMFQILDLASICLFERVVCVTLTDRFCEKILGIFRAKLFYVGIVACIYSQTYFSGMVELLEAKVSWYVEY